MHNTSVRRMNHLTTNIVRSATLTLVILLSLFQANAKAQLKFPDDPEKPDSLGYIVASIVTCDAGEKIYQLEGHAALRLRRQSLLPDQSFDVVINWGVFDFASPNFVYRFVKGETDYMACCYPFDLFMEEYLVEQRQVVEQTLNLSQQEATRLFYLAMVNVQPENCVYRYNYVNDNCATRPIAMIEAAIGGTVEFHDTIADGTTFRSEMARYHANYPWYQFGIDLALGSGLDQPITTRQATFAPLKLRETLETATATTHLTTDGDTRKLVTATKVLYAGAPGGMVKAATPFILSPMALAILLLLVTIAISISDKRRKRLSRWFDSVLFGTFFAASLVVTFLIFISTHEASSPNWLFLWLNPLTIIGAVGIWIKRCERVVYCYQICNFVAVLTLLVGSHLMGQVLNAAFPLLILCDLIRSATQIYLYRTAHCPQRATTKK